MGDVIVSMEHITKEFPGVKALDDVKFNLRAGEVMALLGENGAGKSTLMKILSGVYSLDQGSLKIFGKDYESLTPSSAREAGVAIIHQELNMCKDLTVAQNMFLGREERKGFVLNNSNMEDIARKYLGELGVDISPDEIVGELPVSKQQMIEIAKALSINAKILIMDEPTSALTSREIDELFNIIRKLKSQGCGIVYISHRLEELAHITDRVTIMRDGHYITEGNFTDFTMDEIIANMVGREIKEKFPHVECEKGKKVFEVKNLNAGRLVRDINFSLYEGEIVGFAGLMGAGRTETTRAIFGVDPKESGTLILDGKEITINNPMDAIKAGVVLAPEDRKKDGLCTKLSIRHNIALPNLDLICGKGGVINTKVEEELCDKAVADLTIKTPNLDVDAGTLSGGNQQKVVVGKWLARNSRVVIFDEPTRGIDVAAKVEIYNLMNELKKQGLTDIGVDVDEMDITDAEACRRVITEAKPDAVIHCAAYTAVDAAEQNMELCRKVNAGGTRNIAEVCKSLDIKMMYISTDYVFNGQGTRPWEPDDHREPLNAYGQSKYEGELAVEELVKKFFIVRIAWVFGVNGKNFIKTMLRVGKERGAVSVVDDQIGSPTYTYDLARLLVDMIQSDKYGRYHATNEGLCSWYEFAVEIFKQAGMDVKVTPVSTAEYTAAYPGQAKRPMNSRISKEKLSDNGFERLPSWQDAVGRYLKEIQ